MRKRNFDPRTPNKALQATPLLGAVELLRWAPFAELPLAFYMAGE